MSQLSYAQARYLDPERSDSARRAILEASGVDVSELLAFAELNGGDPQRMFQLHEAIRARVDSLEAIDAGAMIDPEAPPADSGEPR